MSWLVLADRKWPPSDAGASNVAEAKRKPATSHQTSSTMTQPSHSSDDTGDWYSFTYDANEEGQPTLAVVEAVAWVKNIDILDLQPLHYVYDTADLDRQFGTPDRGEFYRSATRADEASPSVTFEYEGCTVMITADKIHVEE